jgi:hypothetical protein
MAMDETSVFGEQSGCGIRLERKTDSMEDQQVEAEGKLEEIDDVGFRRLHGTEWALLDEEEEEVAYALKSDAEELGEYVEQHVRLSGFPVEGFPAEPGAPGYISVTRIDEAYYSE